MKSAKEILVMLVRELIDHLDKVKNLKGDFEYYNDMLGDTSFILAALLESILKSNIGEWDNRKWIDDSLITEFVMRGKSLKIDGIMIWGRENTTEQWTEPFIFEIELLKEELRYKNFLFLLGDLDKPEITYEEFKDNRDYWIPSNRNWQYIINSDEALIESS